MLTYYRLMGLWLKKYYNTNCWILLRKINNFKTILSSTFFDKCNFNEDVFATYIHFMFAFLFNIQ